MSLHRFDPYTLQEVRQHALDYAIRSTDKDGASGPLQNPYDYNKQTKLTVSRAEAFFAYLTGASNDSSGE